MPESNSTAPRAPAKPSKPSKPYADFPLTPHPSGRWCKKILGKIIYFGPWSDPDGALAKYLAEKDALHAGRKPREDTGGLTVKELANRFLAAKQALVDSGELSPRTWQDYKESCDEVVAAFGKGRLVADLDPDDFATLRTKMAKKWGAHRLGKTIQCVRCLFKYGYDVGLVVAPVRYGPGFKRPSKKTMRLHRAGQGVKLFTREEIHKLLELAGPAMKAMILLGINGGLGNSDVGNLPLGALDLDGGWLDYPRPKTGIARRVPLWPETVRAIRAALAKRPEPKDPADTALLFLTKYGQGWAKDVADSPVTKETRKLLDRAGINGHRNFYTLRHTFRTVADEAKDPVAADHVMGHETPNMSSAYRETISDARLKAVTDHVRAWLFGGEKAPGADAVQ